MKKFKVLYIITGGRYRWVVVDAYNKDHAKTEATLALYRAGIAYLTLDNAVEMP